MFIKCKMMLEQKRKLTDEEVEEIRDQYANKQYNQRQLAARYGVTQRHISSIIRRTTRK